MIEVSNLSKKFGDVTALDGLNFKAENGRITGLIGHNGAGKTTCFRILAGLMAPDDGCGRIDGLDVVTDRVAAQARLGMLPDVRGLYPRLTAREHIRYYGRLHGLDGKGLESRIDELVERLEMTGFVDRRCKGFSRGQELKVALARALIHKPRNVVFDEPTNGLDVRSAHGVHELIREMRDEGASIVVSSHIMSEVSTLCEEIVVIAEGRNIMTGTPEELLRHAGVATLEDLFLAVTIRGSEAA